MSSTPADDDQTTKPEIEVSSDESWKEQVRRENEQIEAEYQKQKSQTGSDEASRQGRAVNSSSAVGPLPPPTFESIIHIFSTQAMVGLGAFADPNDQSSGPQLEVARHFIDALGVLEKKTQGNLTSDESRLLTSTLHELRMAFLELSRQAKVSGT